MVYVHYAAHNAVPILFLKKLRKGLVIYTNVHGSDVVPEVPSQEKYQPFVKKLLQVSDCIITPSNYYKELVKSKYQLNNRIEIFPSGGVNSEIFFERTDKISALNELDLNTNFQYIGYVSRLDVGKGWDVFLAALKKLKENEVLHKHRVKAIFVGDGRDKEQFLRIVDELNLEDVVIHFPLLPQKKLNAIYNAIQVFCFPTMRKGESLGLVGLEAMACGSPVIGSAIGGLLDYIDDGVNGFLFEAGSGEELANKIEHYLTLSKSEKKTLSEQAKLKSEEYQVDNIKEHLLNIFYTK